MANKRGQLKEFVEERDRLIQELEQRGREITTLNLGAIKLLNERMKVIVNLQEQEYRLSALLSAVQAVSQSLDLREVLNLAAVQLLKSLDVDGSFIFLLRGEELILTAGQGVLAPELKDGSTSLKLGESLAGKVALTGESISVEDVAADPRYHLTTPHEAGIHSLAAAALRSKDEIRGVVGVATLSRRRFSPKDVELLEALGLQIALEPFLKSGHDRILLLLAQPGMPAVCWDLDLNCAFGTQEELHFHVEGSRELPQYARTGHTLVMLILRDRLFRYIRLLGKRLLAQASHLPCLLQSFAQPYHGTSFLSG